MQSLAETRGLQELASGAWDSDIPLLIQLSADALGEAVEHGPVLGPLNPAG